MWPAEDYAGEGILGECVRQLRAYGDEARSRAGRIAMYRVVYWAGVTLFVAWVVFSAYSALNGL
jgi:hypothetical protein